MSPIVIVSCLCLDDIMEDGGMVEDKELMPRQENEGLIAVDTAMLRMMWMKNIWLHDSRSG